MDMRAFRYSLHFIRTRRPPMFRNWWRFDYRVIERYEKRLGG